MTKSFTGRRNLRLDVGKWSQLLTAQEKSGLSVKAFCAEQGLNAGTYYRWQKLLKQQEAGAVFSPIEIEARPVGGIVVELPGGVVVHLNELPPVGYLRSLSLSFSGGRP